LFAVGGCGCVPDMVDQKHGMVEKKQGYAEGFLVIEGI
jgi:hypothetical protein